MAALCVLVVPGFASADTLRTEKNYQDAILQGLVDQQELTQQQFDFLDFNNDALLDVSDLIDFLLSTQDDVPVASFSSRRSRINEGESAVVTISFTEEFTGFVSFTIRPADGPSGTMSAVDGPSGDYQVLDETGAAIADAAGQVLTFPVASATSVDIPINVLDDAELELIERIELQLVPGEGYITEAPTNHFAFINDNDGRWHGMFIRDGSDARSTFDIDVIQVGTTFTGTLVVAESGSGLFRPGDAGTPVDFTGTNPDTGELHVTISQSSTISAGLTRFPSTFGRSYSLVSTPQTQVPSDLPESPDTVPAEFDRFLMITGLMSEQLGSSNSQLNELVDTARSGAFFLVKEPGKHDILEQIRSAFADDAKSLGKAGGE